MALIAVEQQHNNTPSTSTHAHTRSHVHVHTLIHKTRKKNKWKISPGNYANSQLLRRRDVFAEGIDAFVAFCFVTGSAGDGLSASHLKAPGAVPRTRQRTLHCIRSAEALGRGKKINIVADA